MISAETRSPLQPIRTLVVDDERLARVGLRKMLSVDSELDVIDCASGSEAVSIIEAGAIDLVFLDIRMRDLDGFDVIERIGVHRMPVVVFTTAYRAHALQAFDACALDYLLKPIGDDRLAQAVARAKESVRQRRLGAVSTQLIALLEKSVAADKASPGRVPYRFVIRSGANTLYINASAIDWIESADNYARLWTRGRSYLVREPLQHLANVLRPEGFIRVHRTALVNVARVRELRGAGTQPRTVVLEDGTHVVISRDRLAAVQEALRGAKPSASA